MKKFSPLLAPNDKINLDEINYPLFASTKLDGIRLIIKDGQLLTRSLKSLPNKQLCEKFEALKEITKFNDVIFDGEIYAHGIPFQFILSCVMTHDYSKKLAIKKWNELCKEYSFNLTREEVLDKLKFYCFDCVRDEKFDEPFELRICHYEYGFCLAEMRKVEQITVKNKEQVEKYFNEVLKEGYEGLILRDLNGRYKFGRGTVKEGLIYKVKPFLTFDAKIIDVVQATEVNEDAEKTINELGYSVTSKKQADRHLIEKASAFKVMYEGNELKVSLAMNDEQKEEVWKNKEKYIGRMIEFKGMLVGAKDVPRHPIFVRWRIDRD